MSKMKYGQIYDGEPFTVKYRQVLNLKGAVMKISCCDCGLVHEVVVMPMKTRARIYFYRDNRATAARRRNKRFKGVRV